MDFCAVISFPSYKPTYYTLDIMHKLLEDNPSKECRRRYYRTIRGGADGFIKRKEVREFIFNRDGRRCVICGSEDRLSIDHINSVYSVVYKNSLNPMLLNSKENLRTLCASCNSKHL